MPTRIEVRETAPEDVAGIEAFYPKAFPDEDLLPVLKALWGESEGVLSLTATVDGALAGHVCFTECEISECDAVASMLAPLAVDPAMQGIGVGTAIVEEGHRRLKHAGIDVVLVLGDPAYYRRFGFVAETDIAPPYALPAEWRDAWQSVDLSDAAPGRQGKLIVPPPWRDAKLWAP